MSAYVLAWSAARRAALTRPARLLALAVLLAGVGAVAWLGWREARLAGLPQRTNAALEAQLVLETRLRLKYLANVANLAKVANNSLLKEVSGIRSSEEVCIHLHDLRSLPDDSPCATQWDRSLEKLWARAFGPDAPPIPDRLRRDPWGRPFLLNETEWICGAHPVFCPTDTVRSVGPDGFSDTDDDITEMIPQLLGPSLNAALRGMKE